MNAKLRATLLVALTAAVPALAWPGGRGGLAGKRAGGSVQVKGYTKKDGTHVQPHTRSLPGARSSIPGGPPLAPRLAPPSGRSESGRAPAVDPSGYADEGPDAPTSPQQPPRLSSVPTPASKPTPPLSEKLPVVTLVPVNGRVTIAFLDGDLALYEEWSALRSDQAAGLVRDGKVVVFSGGFPVEVVQRFERGLVKVRGTYGKMKDRIAYTRAVHLPPVDLFAK